MAEYRYLVTVTTDDSQLVADMGMAQRLGLRDTPDSAINWKPVDVAGMHADLLAAAAAADGDSNDDEIELLQQVADDLMQLVGEPPEPDEDEHPDCTAGKHTPELAEDGESYLIPAVCSVCGHTGDDVLHKFSSSHFGGTIWCLTCNSTLCDLL